VSVTTATSGTFDGSSDADSLRVRRRHHS